MRSAVKEFNDNLIFLVHKRLHNKETGCMLQPFTELVLTRSEWITVVETFILSAT